MTHRGPFQPLLFCDSVILWNSLHFPLLPSSPPTSLAVAQGLTAPLQARAQGLPAAKKGRCLHHTPAHRLLCLPLWSRFLPSLSSASPQALPGAESGLYSGTHYNGMAHGTRWSGCKQQGSSYHYSSVLGEHWWGVLQLTSETTEQDKEGLTWVITTGDGGNGILTGKRCKPSIAVPYLIVQTRMPQEPVSGKDCRWMWYFKHHQHRHRAPTNSTKFKSLDENYQREYNYHSTWLRLLHLTSKQWCFDSCCAKNYVHKLTVHTSFGCVPVQNLLYDSSQDSKTVSVYYANAKGIRNLELLLKHWFSDEVGN